MICDIVLVQLIPDTSNLVSILMIHMLIIYSWFLIGEIPSLKIYETAKTLAFMDIGPTAPGHALVIPKYHGAKLHNIPDEHLVEILPIAKRIALALNLNIESPEGEGYNVLQNNGRIAHQMVDHVHFHLIPKRDEKSGLIVGWPESEQGKNQVKEIHAKLAAALKDLDTSSPLKI